MGALLDIKNVRMEMDTERPEVSQQQGLSVEPVHHEHQAETAGVTPLSEAVASALQAIPPQLAAGRPIVVVVVPHA